MSTLHIQAIDVHAHYGEYDRSEDKHLGFCMSADAAEVVQRARDAQTQWTIVSALKSLLPRGRCDAFAGNEEAARIVPATPGLLYYAVINPLQPRSFDQARQLLKNPHCVGLKVHPEEHRYPIRDYGQQVFEFAAEVQAVTLVHSGEQFSMPEDYVVFANQFPGFKLILAHIGCGYNGDRTLQARAIQKSKHGNVYADTSSAQSILPRNIEWAAKEAGVDRILYGTDTPLYFSAMQRARIDYADLSDTDKRMILRENAIRLFGEKIAPFVGAREEVVSA